MLKRFLLIFLVCELLLTLPSVVLSETSKGKLIEWGWRTPFPTYIKDHIREMESLPV